MGGGAADAPRDPSARPQRGRRARRLGRPRADGARRHLPGRRAALRGRARRKGVKVWNPGGPGFGTNAEVKARLEPSCALAGAERGYTAKEGDARRRESSAGIKLDMRPIYIEPCVFARARRFLTKASVSASSATTPCSSGVAAALRRRTRTTTRRRLSGGADEKLRRDWRPLRLFR